MLPSGRTTAPPEPLFDEFVANQPRHPLYRYYHAYEGMLAPTTYQPRTCQPGARGYGNAGARRRSLPPGIRDARGSASLSAASTQGNANLEHQLVAGPLHFTTACRQRRIQCRQEARAPGRARAGRNREVPLVHRGLRSRRHARAADIVDTPRYTEPPTIVRPSLPGHRPLREQAAGPHEPP